MSTDVADLGIKIDFTETVKAREALDRLEEAAKRAATKGVSVFEKAWLDLVKGLGAYDILKKIASTLLEAGEKALFAGETYARLAAIAGTTASAISAFEEPARKSGVAIETVATAIAKLGRSIGEARLGNENQKLLLGVFGISPTDTRDAAAIFQDVGRTLIGMKDQTVATALAFPLLGRSLAELKPLLKEMVEQGELHARVTEEQKKRSKELADNLVTLKLQSEDAAIAIVSKLTPAMNTAVVAATRFLAVQRQMGASGFLPIGLAISGLAAVGALNVKPPVSGFQSQVRAVDNQILGEGSSEEAEAAGRKLLSDQKLYDARIAKLKGFSAQYMTAVKALAALIEADDDQSVSRQENHLAKQQQMNDAALQAQIAYLEKERAFAGAIGKTKEVAEFTAAIAQLNAQRVTDEVITSARISAIRRDNLLKGVDDYRTYIASVENAGAELAETQLEMDERIYTDRLQKLDVFIKANQDMEAKGAAAKLRLLQQHEFDLIGANSFGIKSRVEIEKMGGQQQLAYYTGTLANITAAGAQHDKRLFELNKVAGIANAIVSANIGAAAALKWGWPLGPIFAGIIWAAAAANIHAIRSAQFGSSTSAPSVGGGSATATFPASGSTGLQQPPAPPSGPQVQIIINGNIIGQEDYVRNTIIPIILDGVQTQDLRLVPPQSRNAQDIRDNAP